MTSKNMTTVRAAARLLDGPGFSEQMRMYGFLVVVEGMEACEAYALAFGKPVRHGGEKCSEARP